MNIASLKYTRRVNLGNYEHNELTVEVVPDDGQTAEDAVARTKAFVESNLPLGKGAPVTSGQPTPPLAGKAGGSDPTASSSTPTNSASGSTQDAPPKKRGRGRPPKALTEAKAAVDKACEANSFEELLERMNAARERASAFKPDEWRACCKRFKDRYAAVNSAAEDPKVGEQIVAWFHAEWTAIEANAHWEK